jgi:uncharacterized protein (TIGR03118 family)
MNRVWIPVVSVAAAAGISLALAAPAQHYEMTVLLSDGSVAAPNVNPNLVNPWGMATSPTGPFWISNEGTGTASIVNAEGEPFAPDVNVPADQSAHPTGLVFNGGGGFEITDGTTTATSLFIYVSEDGRLLGWNPTVLAPSAIVAVDNRGTGSAYTGAALAQNSGDTFLYVANFGQGTVDVFDSTFTPVNSFTDTTLPENFSPFGIAAIDGRLYVTFAERDPTTGEDVPGPGKGYIDVFTPAGELERRLVSEGELNAPWGLVVASPGFGKFSRKLLVGNFGDGRILAYSSHNGHFFGALEDEDGEPLVIEGIWTLLFGNGGDGGDPHDLYFTAGIEDETHGIFGEIEFEH